MGTIDKFSSKAKQELARRRNLREYRFKISRQPVWFENLKKFLYGGY